MRVIVQIYCGGVTFHGKWRIYSQFGKAASSPAELVAETSPKFIQRFGKSDEIVVLQTLDCHRYDLVFVQLRVFLSIEDAFVPENSPGLHVSGLQSYR
jgi:hypothetical protein